VPASSRCGVMGQVGSGQMGARGERGGALRALHSVRAVAGRTFPNFEPVGGGGRVSSLAGRE
jgi:hypothetical protein